ncbi:DNA polymerase alpha catalytic subunit-like protein, partial [Trifolium pratense]
MADEDGSSSRKRRPTRGPDATARSQALELLRSRRSGGPRSDAALPQIRLENPIYDTIPEDEYNALVASRRDQARSFIVDDQGIGYGDEGEEEDWSKAGFSLTDDESEGESEKPKRKKEASQTKRTSSSVAAKLSAAAAMMGGQRVSSMFTSAVFKNSRDDKACESLVDEVLKEFAPDETDKLSRRKLQSNSSSIVNDATRINPSSEAVRVSSSQRNNFVIANVDTESVNVNKDKDNGSRLGLEQKCEVQVNRCSENDDEEKMMVEQPNDCPSSNGNLVEEKPVKAKEDEMEAKPVIKKEGFTLNAKVNQEAVDPKLCATVGWQAARSGAGGGGEINVADSNNQQHSEFNLETEGSLPFYILDAYEEYYGANMGTLYLFGKVKAGNLYQSCCVVVKNMQRCVYAIPSHPLHSIDEMIKLEKDVQESRISPADFRKKLQDAVSDTKNEVAKHLVDLGVSTFSMAPVKRKYAFERSDIPA